MLPTMLCCHLPKILIFEQEMMYFSFAQSLQITVDLPYFNLRGIQYE